MREDSISGNDNAPAPGRRLRGGLVAAGAALGMTLAGLGVAQAQIDDRPEDPTGPPALEQAPTPAPGEGKRFHHRAGKGLHGFGMGIRGEAVTRKQGGGFQTIAHQVGVVTAVNATSVTVRSEDGFDRTYAVDDKTLVNAGNNGIADVEAGDKVRVLAVVEDGRARAVDIRDVTRIRESRQQWMPAPPERTGA